MKVVDPSGAAVPGIKVSVKLANGDEAANGVTNSEGVFETTELAPGHYTVQCFPAQGLMFAEPERVLVKRGKITQFEEKAMIEVIGEIVFRPKPEIKPH